MWLACDTGRAGREVWAGWVQGPALVEHQSGPSQRARAGCWQDTWAGYHNSRAALSRCRCRLRVLIIGWLPNRGVDHPPWGVCYAEEVVLGWWSFTGHLGQSGCGGLWLWAVSAQAGNDSINSLIRCLLQ